MAWMVEENRVPTSIPELRVYLTYSAAETPTKRAGVALRILDQNGELFRKMSGDLQPHLLPAEQTALMDFMDTLLARAEAELLP
jgi:hypothetical protein